MQLQTHRAVIGNQNHLVNEKGGGQVQSETFSVGVSRDEVSNNQLFIQDNESLLCNQIKKEKKKPISNTLLTDQNEENPVEIYWWERERRDTLGVLSPRELHLVFLIKGQGLRPCGLE